VPPQPATKDGTELQDWNRTVLKEVEERGRDGEIWVHAITHSYLRIVFAPQISTGRRVIVEK
jgi:hypothetical protein